jgi:hypothetical protein
MYRRSPGAKERVAELERRQKLGDVAVVPLYGDPG